MKKEEEQWQVGFPFDFGTYLRITLKMSLTFMGPQFDIFKILTNLVEAAGVVGNGLSPKACLGSVPHEQSDIGESFSLSSFFL